jgi:hypothetical protein
MITWTLFAVKKKRKLGFCGGPGATAPVAHPLKSGPVRNRIPLEKLIRAQLVKECPTLHGARW